MKEQIRVHSWLISALVQNRKTAFPLPWVDSYGGSQGVREYPLEQHSFLTLTVPTNQRHRLQMLLAIIQSTNKDEQFYFHALYLEFAGVLVPWTTHN